ncbi:MAG: tRNA (adenosine(37)-N6)-threonylcarbamoyltransferase complex ATPase subunit type 1 TsaE [Thermotogae bacterium]|nr:tRNA (adenosine(37)-N6)-threonylcarbamoyltransferase complex ATPase subunit type 1 TsaE [Thermotogota bacterium]
MGVVRRFITRSPEETEVLGQFVFCRYARRYRTFLLFGEMGSGKTTFVRGFAGAAGYGNVRSPTFTMVSVYPTPSGRIHHVDLYRLEAPDALYSLGFMDMIGRDIVIVEWAENLPEDVEAVRIDLSVKGEGERVITVSLP